MTVLVECWNRKGERELVRVNITMQVPGKIPYRQKFTILERIESKALELAQKAVCRDQYKIVAFSVSEGEVIS